MLKFIMEDYKDIKVKLLFLVVLLLSVFSLIIFYYEKSNIQNEINKRNDTLRDNIDKTFNTLLDDLKINTSKRIEAMLLLNDNFILKKFALQDREGLYKVTKAKYDFIKLENEYLKIMTFRLSDGTAFLRVHKPKMYGDKLNQKRKIIVDTNRLQKKHFGFEVGKLKMTYRVVIPIFYKDKHIGLVEVGIEPEYIMKRLNKIYNLKNALLIKKDMKSVSIDKKKLKIVEKDYYLARGDELFQKYSDKIIFDKQHNHIIDKGKEYHIDSNLNLLNHKNEIAAKLLIAYDTTNNISEFDRLLKVNIIRIILLVLIILVVLNISFNYFINKIIVETRKNIQNEKQLLESSKMVSMGEMIGNIAHQWRQPLSVISSASTGMIIKKQLNILDDESLVKTCNVINDNAQYLSRTIEDFKNFIKGDREKETIVLKDTIDSFINLVQGSIKNHHINLTLELEEDIKFDSYPNELIQCFINIFNNSKDAYPKDDLNKMFFINTTKENDNVIIKFRDNAGGIPEEVLPKIFEPYFTTKHMSQGTGLGLNMAYNLIVDGMDGDIKADNKNYTYENNEYIGAEFTITLPIS